VRTEQAPPEPDTLDKQRQRRRTVRNRRIGASAGAAVILTGVVIAIVVNGSGADDRATAPPSSSAFTGVPFSTYSYFDIATGKLTPVAADLTGADMPEVSPNGESVVYFTFDTDAIFVKALDGSDEQTIKLPGLSAVAPTWIDDQTILFQGRSIHGGPNEVGNLYQVNISTGDVSMVTDLPLEKFGNWFIESDVSPDGTTVLFHLPRATGERGVYDLWTAPIAGGKPTLLRKDAGFAQYGPDGSIVFLDHPGFRSDAIWVMDGDGGHARPLVEGGRYTTWPRFSPDGATVSFADNEVLEIVDVVSGKVTKLPVSTHEQDPAWYDADTLIVG